MRRSLRLAAFHVAFAAMVLRALVPAGWMPSAEARGAPLTICEMDGGMMHHMPVQKPGPAKADHQVCPFAAAAALAWQPDITASAPVRFAAPAPPAPDRGIVLHAQHYNPHASRGPPSAA